MSCNCCPLPACRPRTSWLGKPALSWSPAWRVIIRFTDRMAHQRYASTVPDVERNDGQSRSGSSTASWWLLPHQGKSFSDSSAAGNGFKAQSPHLCSPRYSSVLPRYRIHWTRHISPQPWRASAAPASPSPPVTRKARLHRSLPPFALAQRYSLASNRIP